MLKLGCRDPGPFGIPVFPPVRLSGIFVIPEGDELAAHKLEFFTVWEGERAALYGGVHQEVGNKKTRFPPPPYGHVWPQYLTEGCQQPLGGCWVRYIAVEAG